MWIALYELYIESTTENTYKQQFIQQFNKASDIKKRINEVPWLIKDLILSQYEQF